MITISPTYLLIWKDELLWVSVRPYGVFSRGNLPPDHPCKSHGSDHQWADLVMA